MDRPDERIGDFLVSYNFDPYARYVGDGGVVIIPDELGEVTLDFTDAKGITQLHFPKTMKTLFADHFTRARFGSYDTLEKVVFTQGLERIFDNNLFAGCKTLTDVVLPDSLYLMPSNAFKDTPWRDANTEVVDGCHYLGRFLIGSDKGLTKATIRPGTVAVCSRSFYNREFLEAVSIPASVKCIDVMAFCNCCALKELVVPQGDLTHIANSAFTGCTGLEVIDLPDSCTNISPIAFVSNTGQVMLHPKKAYIPFMSPECGTIQREFHTACYLTCPDRHSPESQAMYQAHIKRNKSRYLPLLIDTCNIPVLRSMGKDLISNKNIDDLLDYAAKNNLTEITAFLLDFQRNVLPAPKKKSVDAWAIKEPTAADLKKIWGTKKLPNGTLGITAYKGTDTEVVIPAVIGKTPVTSIEKGAFSTFYPYVKTTEQQTARQAITSITIPEGVTRIEGFAFNGCRSLRSVVIPASVAAIQNTAFFSTFPDLTIHAPAGSIAETIAKKNHIPFEST